MGFDQRQLGADEHVILHMRTHLKKLFWQILLFIAMSVALGIFLALQPVEWKPWGTYVTVSLYVIVAIIWVLWPFLKWLTTTYTVTNRRIITRTGVVTRTGHDLPLRRVNNVRYERDLLDRILGCGTLVLETAAEEPLVLPDLPSIESVHIKITDVLFSDMTGESSVHDD